MRFKSLSIAALLLAVFSITALAAKGLPRPQSSLPTPTMSAEPIDQIVATVNNGIVTQSEIDTVYKHAIKQIAKSGKPAPNKSTLKNEILQQIIYKKLQLQLAKRAGLKVTQSQIDHAIKSIAKQHHVSIAGLMKKVSLDGYTPAKYRVEIKQQILVTTLQHQALAKDVNVTNADITQFLAQYQTEGKYATKYHLIDLRIPLPEAATTVQSKQAKAQALKIMKKLRAGADEYKLAAVQVTDMGWGTTSTIPDIFTHQLATAKVGTIIGPLRAGNGYHVVIVKGLKTSKHKPPTKEQVKQILFQQKIGKALEKWLTKLRKSADVKIIVPQ